MPIGYGIEKKNSGENIPLTKIPDLKSDAENFDEVSEAIRGVLGDDQQRIAFEGLRFLRLLLQKNRDYGSSAWQAPVLCPAMPSSAAILVRMSDKVRRIEQLSQAKANVADESLEDTVRDLGGYCLLYLTRPK